MELTEGGVDVHLDIEKDWDRIPADSIALVGNRSAVGEQYVELQPKVDDGPFLRENSEIDRADTKIPIATSKLPEDISNTVSSVDQADQRTTVNELGQAFVGTGEDPATIIEDRKSDA